MGLKFDEKFDEFPQHDILFYLYMSNRKPGHITGGSRRGARRGGGAGSGRTVRQQNCSPREQSFIALSKASKTRRLNVSPEAQTIEILCKPMEQNPRLTTGSSAVYQRFITGTRSAFSSWLPTSRTTLFFFVNHFHAGHVRELNRFGEIDERTHLR